MKTMKRIATTMLMLAIIGFTSCGGNTEKAMDPDSTVAEMEESMSSMKTIYLEYETHMEASGYKNTSTTKVWRDIENERGYSETQGEMEMMGQKRKIHSAQIDDKDTYYILNLLDKTGYKMEDEPDEDEGGDFMGDLNIEEDETTWREMIESEGGKIIGKEKLLGRECIVVEQTMDDEDATGTMKYWYYKGIPMKAESAQMKMEIKKFDENIRIPSDKFKVPQGIKISKMPGMGF